MVEDELFTSNLLKLSIVTIKNDGNIAIKNSDFYSADVLKITGVGKFLYAQINENRTKSYINAKINEHENTICKITFDTIEPGDTITVVVVHHCLFESSIKVTGKTKDFDAPKLVETFDDCQLATEDDIYATITKENYDEMDKTTQRVLSHIKGLYCIIVILVVIILLAFTPKILQNKDTAIKISIPKPKIEVINVKK